MSVTSRNSGLGSPCAQPLRDTLALRVAVTCAARRGPSSTVIFTTPASHVTVMFAARAASRHLALIPLRRRVRCERRWSSRGGSRARNEGVGLLAGWEQAVPDLVCVFCSGSCPVVVHTHSFCACMSFMGCMAGGRERAKVCLSDAMD